MQQAVFCRGTRHTRPNGPKLLTQPSQPPFALHFTLKQGDGGTKPAGWLPCGRLARNNYYMLLRGSLYCVWMRTHTHTHTP